MAAVPKERTVDCFCNKTDWSLFVSQKSTSLGAGGGGVGGVTVPPPDDPFEQENIAKIIPARILKMSLCLFIVLNSYGQYMPFKFSFCPIYTS